MWEQRSIDVEDIGFDHPVTIIFFGLLIIAGFFMVRLIVKNYQIIKKKNEHGNNK